MTKNKRKGITKNSLIRTKETQRSDLMELE